MLKSKQTAENKQKRLDDEGTTKSKAVIEDELKQLFKKQVQEMQKKVQDQLTQNFDVSQKMDSENRF